MKNCLILFLSLLGFVLLAGCGSETVCPGLLAPHDIKPPLGLIAYPGDRAVTLEFISANSRSEWNDFWGFAAHMAEGDFSAGKVPGSYFEDPDVENFDTYGDGWVCGGESCESDTNGLQPVAYVEGGIDHVEAELGVEIPGVITWLIQDGDMVPVLGDVEEGDDDDDAADDDDDDEAALVFPAQATAGDDDITYPIATTGENGYPSTTGGGTLMLQNGQIYTVFVVTRSDEGQGASWTSNYATFIPRPESAEITLTPGPNWFCNDGIANGLDIGEAGVESFTVANFNSCTGLYVGADEDEQKIDLVLEASNAEGLYGLAGERPYFSAANGNLLQDLGYYADWALAFSAPIDENSYVTPGVSVLAIIGHVYAISTGDGYFAKVQVKSIDESNSSVTLIAAYQTLPGNPSLK
jgi:hypothetical protein